MATGDVSLSFVKQYEREVHEAYQRQGSKLRSTVRVKNGVRGSSTTFQKVGKGVATTKPRHGVIPADNLDHTPIECTLGDHYRGEWVDKLDELKINHDERMVVANAGAWALGRKTDDLIIDALETCTDINTMLTTSSLTFRNSVVEALEALYGRDVPDDGKLTAVISPRFWSWLMTIEEYASADFVNAKPYADGSNMTAKRWLNVTWIYHTGLPLATNDRSCFLYHMTAIGHAIGQEVQADITWHGDRAAHFIAHSMSQGSCLIDDDGVVEMKLDESVTLPSS